MYAPSADQQMKEMMARELQQQHQNNQ